MADSFGPVLRGREPFGNHSGERAGRIGFGQRRLPQGTHPGPCRGRPRPSLRLEIVLAQEEDIQVVGEAGDGAEAV
ncbi:DNA-binding response regulator [Streptomyces narbonensis]